MKIFLILFNPENISGKYLFGVFDNRDSHEKNKIIWGEE